MKRTTIAMAMCILAAMSGAATAGPDELQRQTIQRIQESKLKLQTAEKAKGAERDKLLQEHMKMMQETVEKMRAMKPRTGMTMQEHEEWIAEHQKLMEQVMGQMMEEHHLIIKTPCR